MVDKQCNVHLALSIRWYRHIIIQWDQCMHVKGKFWDLQSICRQFLLHLCNQNIRRSFYRELEDLKNAQAAQAAQAQAQAQAQAVASSRLDSHYMDIYRMRYVEFFLLAAFAWQLVVNFLIIHYIQFNSIIDFVFYPRGLHPSQYPLYTNPAAAAAMSQLERERLGIPPHHVGLDPSDPMVPFQMTTQTLDSINQKQEMHFASRNSEMIRFFSLNVPFNFVRITCKNCFLLSSSNHRMLLDSNFHVSLYSIFSIFVINVT